MALTDWTALHGERFVGRRCVVTGGAGFIGSHLVEALLRLGAEVVVLDDFSGGSRGNVEAAVNAAMGGTGDRSQAAGLNGSERLTVVEGTILDEGVVGDAVEGCGLVFHQAALGSVPRSVKEPGAFAAANTTGTFNVLQACVAGGVERVVFAASSSAYGDSEVLPKVETMPVRPKSPYAATKVAGEAMLRAWAGSYGLDTVSLRYFNIFGPRQNANSAYAAVIAAFAKALLAGDRPVIYGDGEQSRDFTFVDNAVHANLCAAGAEGPVGGEVVNVACGERVSVNVLAERMAGMLGMPELEALHEAERAGDVKHSLADVGLAKALIGYEPVVGFEAGLEATVAWYREEGLGGRL
ncbi:MAG: NAD-dependent epimerase/dehydratase family protein [Planctomycetota bacterium]